MVYMTSLYSPTNLKVGYINWNLTRQGSQVNLVQTGFAAFGKGVQLISGSPYAATEQLSRLTSPTDSESEFHSYLRGNSTLFRQGTYLLPSSRWGDYYFLWQLFFESLYSVYWRMGLNKCRPSGLLAQEYSDWFKPPRHMLTSNFDFIWSGILATSWW